MSNRNKYKGLGLLVALFLFITLGLLADNILALNPTLLSVILIESAISGALIFAFVMLHSLIRTSWPLTRKNIFSWILSFLLVIIPMSGAGIWLSLEALKEIWLQEVGVLTTANILHLETGRFRGSEFCEITYQWQLMKDNTQVKLYTGEEKVYTKSAKCLSWGEGVTIRHLPSIPTISRIETESDTVTGIVVISLMMSFFLILTLPSYILIEGITIK